MFSAEKNNLLSAALRRNRSIAKLASLILLGFAATVFMRGRQVTANLDNDGKENSYAIEIAKTYDFKFGPNPFSPGNATTTTGTFMAGGKFVSAKPSGSRYTEAY